LRGSLFFGYFLGLLGNNLFTFGFVCFDLIFTQMIKIIGFCLDQLENSLLFAVCLELFYQKDNCKKV
jgi:hypothetical protein